MKLYLVQHGQANPEEIDPEKNLSEQGKTDLEKVCAMLSDAGIKPLKIWHSGKARAEQTAKLIAGLLHLDAEIAVKEGMQPNDPVEVIAKSLEAETGDLMLAGHLPHLNKLASMLLGKDENLNLINFRMGGILCLEKGEAGGADSGRTGWQVDWMVVPGVLSR